VFASAGLNERLAAEGQNSPADLPSPSMLAASEARMGRRSLWIPLR
jgi:hypothetical protein